MRKIYFKLMASMAAIIAAITMVVGATYAWLTISESPAVNGINVGIAGGRTILLAPDITEMVTDENGQEVTVHYPGAFSDTLNLSRYDTYDYLGDLAPLSPVSTVDGLHWILPEYNEVTGSIKDMQEFTVDSTLNFANGTKEQEGAYAYLDFWIVSPGTDYNIRVSTDTKTNLGSFLMELPRVVSDENGGYTLEYGKGQIASTARVGFLVNSDTGSNAGMSTYMSSDEYDNRFKMLRGQYTESGEAAISGSGYRFTIYEPNATLHPSGEEGSYAATRPLGYHAFTDTIEETDLYGTVTAQQAGSWRLMEDEVWLEQILQAAVAGREIDSAQTANEVLYNEYLSGQVAAYVAAGNFFTNTAQLQSEAAGGAGTASASVIEEKMTFAGATEDVIITTLERNKPQRIRMFIWLEGQDADCQNTASVTASSFSLGLELSGETN